MNLGSRQFVMFSVRECSRGDVVPVEEFFRYTLYKDEPLACTVPLSQVPEPGKGLASKLVPQGLSVVALDAAHRVIGVCINDEPPQLEPAIYSLSTYDLKFQELFERVEKECGIDEVAPRAVELRLMAVASDWRQRGVGSALVRASEAAAAAAGYSYIKAFCTSHFSQRLLQKLGWNLVYSLPYLHICQMSSGISLPPLPHSHVTVFVKKLSYH